MSQAGSYNGGGGGLSIPVTVPNGGTGQISLPAHTVLIGNGTSAISTAGPGSVGYVLTGQGAGADPIFSQIVAGSNMTITNTGNGVITFASSGGAAGDLTFNGDTGTATSNAGQLNIFGNSTQGISFSGDGLQTITGTIADATTSQKGVMEFATSAESIAGTSSTVAVTPDALKEKLGVQTQYGVAIGNTTTGALQYTAAGLANTVLLGNGSANPSFGSVPNAALSNSSVTLSSGNNITVTGGGPLSLGGVASFNVTGTTTNAVQIGNASGSLSSLAVGNNGQVLLGATAGAPAFGTLTSTGGTVSFTTGANSLNLDVTAGSGVILTLTGDSGGTLSPTLGNFNLLGNSTQGVSTSGAASTLTFTVADATTLQRGVTLLASNAEALVGNSTSKAITPEDLKVKLGTQTNHGVALGQTTASALAYTSAGATNTVLVGQGAAADPIFTTVPNAALANSSITLSNGNNITVTGSPVSLGGAATIAVTGTTNHAIQLGNSSGSLTSATALTNGQLLIGSTGLDPVAASLTAGSGITITPAAGSITIASSAGASSANSVVNFVDDFIVFRPLSGTTDLLLSSQSWTCQDHDRHDGTGVIDSAHPGVTTNTATTFVSGDNFNLISDIPGQSIVLGGGALTINWVIKIGALSTATNRYIMRVGLGTTLAADQVNGCYFEYSDNINSGNWVLKTASASTRTTTNTATAVATGWYNLQISVNAGGTSISYSINSVAAGTIATNIPSVGISPFFDSIISAGTLAAGSLAIDLVYLTQTLTSAR